MSGTFDCRITITYMYHGMNVSGGKLCQRECCFWTVTCHSMVLLASIILYNTLWPIDPLWCWKQHVVNGFLLSTDLNVIHTIVRKQLECAGML